MKVQSLFSTRLKMLRKQKHLTQQKLADNIGVNRVRLTNWERGAREPSIQNILKLAKVLDTTTDYLLGLMNRRR